MTTLDDLKSFATPVPTEGGEAETTLVLRTEDEIDPALAGLDLYFREHGSCQAVRLVLQGQKVGYLNRRDFCSADSLDRGLGVSDHMELPGGAALRLLELRCPVQGCSVRKLGFTYDERHPETCPRHPGQALKVAA